MRFHLSSASVPNPLGRAVPQPAPARPQIVKPVPPKPRPRGLLWGLAALALVAGGGYLWNANRVRPENGGGGPSVAALRTAVVSYGELKRSVRLGGSIQAERFAALIAPQLHGNRGSMSGNRGGSVGGGGGGGGSSSNASSAPAPSAAPSTTTIASSNTA